ncbi:LysR family transcriptional regulator [Brevibacillus choshinensis]|uniref:LysR family transcriptional regulator n=1 Tax=Brevibacillus choshinensis TaxID=54911 RepID=A0ABX7FP24_BRECH|nr:LysR family transcriptional regulator [Brevibacillus choshinensis]QRG67057.1 LysR family transcriptional regulator [Brevibacillus choshinensis]
MNLHALRIFIEVARRGSVTAAADALSISQPAVSAQIRKLEHELAIPLVAPDGRGISLTAEGTFLFEQARRIYDWEKEIEWQLAEMKEGTKGQLRLTSTFLPSHYLVPKWLASYKQNYPQVEVDIRTGNSQKSIERLLRCEADLAIITNEVWKDLPFHRIHLMDVNFLFIVPPSHPFAGQDIPLEQLVQEPFLLREPGSSTREKLFSLCLEHQVQPPQIGLQYHGLFESIQSVRAGYGTMLAPALAVTELIARGEVGHVTVPGVDIKRPLYLCLRTDMSEQRPVIKRFAEMVLQSCQT